MANNAQVQGPLAASTIGLSNNVTDTFSLVVQVPVGAPGNQNGYTTAISAPHGFSG